jgi:hypothetical protein
MSNNGQNAKRYTMAPASKMKSKKAKMTVILDRQQHTGSFHLRF